MDWRWYVGGALIPVVAVAVFFIGFIDWEERAARVETQRLKAEARLGLISMLNANEALDGAVIVLGRELSENKWDFRGQLQGVIGEQPFYGRAQAACEEELSRPECWRLSMLEVGGESVLTIPEAEQAEEAGGAAQPDEAPPQDATPPEGDEAAPTEAEDASPGAEEASAQDVDAQDVDAQDVDAQDVDAQDVDAQGADTANAEVGGAFAATATLGSGTEGAAAIETRTVAAAAAGDGDDIPEASAPAGGSDGSAEGEITAPQPTHLVAGQRINVRSGPGRAYDSLGFAYRGQDLLLLESRGEWGRFRLIGGEFDGEEAWLFFALVAPRR